MEVRCEHNQLIFRTTEEQMTKQRVVTWDLDSLTELTSWPYYHIGLRSNRDSYLVLFLGPQETWEINIVLCFV